MPAITNDSHVRCFASGRSYDQNVNRICHFVAKTNQLNWTCRLSSNITSVGD